MQFKHDCFYFIKPFLKLCILHFNLIPLDWFHAYKIFDPCWQTTGTGAFWRFYFRQRFYHSKNYVETGTSNSPKLPSLKNLVVVVAHTIQTAIAFGELSNLCGVSHYPAGRLHFFYWSILVSFVTVHHLICPADGNILHN